MKGFDLLPTLTRRAENSRFYLWILNFLLSYIIPFNRPHGFCLLEVGSDIVRTTASYKRRNHNHVRGIHACAIATIAEFSAGFLLLINLDPTQYRLIMSRIEVDYSYQAKERIVSESTISMKRLAAEVLDPLRDREAVSIEIASRVTDISGNSIAEARTTWQIKKWSQVRTKV